MALINCPECGREISDTANKCPHCGYVQKSILRDILANKKKLKRATALVVAAVCVTLAIIILWRPNIQMDDFNVKNGRLATLLFLGIPTEIDEGEWVYDECGIKFYNIPVRHIGYDVLKGKYSLHFDGEYIENLKNVMRKHCDDAKYVYLFTEYTYNELEISVDYDVDFLFMLVK